MQKKLRKIYSRFCDFKLSRDDACISFWCAFSFIGLGTTLVIFGPTLLDLSDHVGVSIAQLAAVIFARSVGSVIGAGGSGFICDKFHKVSLWMLSIDILIASFLTCIIPLPKNIFILGTFMFLHGVCLGALDNGVHAILMKIWKKTDTGPIMQVIHATFAFGAFLSPIITKPFLSASTNVTTYIENVSCADVLNYTIEVSCTNDLFNSCNETGPDWLIDSKDMIVTVENCSETSTVNGSSNFAYAYWVAVIPLLMPLPPLIFYAVKRQCICKRFLKNKRKASTQIEEETDNSNTDSNKYPPSKIYKGIVLLMLFIFMAVYVGTEVSFGTYIFAFTVKGSLGFSKDRAIAITSLFWGTFSFMRAFSIIFSLLKVPPSVMLGGNLTGSFLAALIMFIWKDNDIAIWIGSGLLGSSVSAIYPNIMVWMSQHIPPTGKVTGVLGTGAVVGDTLFPLLVGVLLDKWSPLTLLYFTFSAIVLCVVIAIVTFTGAKLYLRRWKKHSAVFSVNGTAGSSVTYNRLQFEEVELSLVNEGAESLDEGAESLNNGEEFINVEESNIDEYLTEMNDDVNLDKRNLLR